MWLIAESGSTKTDWLFLNEDNITVERYSTTGINPTFLNEEIITELLTSELMSELDGAEITEVFFFAAGAASERLKGIIRRGLRNVFVEAKILVEHDLMACAFACYEGEPCICCILGTGSNSIYFDGKDSYKAVPSLAYILGDEASGTWFSKRLLRSYYYKKLPEDLREKFIEEYGSIPIEKFLKRIYEDGTPNTYLASFMPFIVEHKNHPFFRRIIRCGVREFLDIHVQCYEESSDARVHFVGSVATLLQDEIREVGEEMALKIGNFVQKPAVRLKPFLVNHKKRLFP